MSGVPEKWYGWLWSDGRWRRVAEGATLATASRALGRVTPKGTPNLAVGLTGGGVPSWKP
jgi:hypothetical protein